MSTTGVPSKCLHEESVEVLRATGRRCFTRSNRQSGSDSWHRLCHDNAEAVTIA